MSYNELLNSTVANNKNVIYKFTNLVNGKVYIGQTSKRFRDRLSDHIWKMKNNPCYFHKAISKYGLHNFDIQILQQCDDACDLNGLEIYWIDYYDSTNRDKGYNLTKGGSGKTLYRNNEKYQHQDSNSTRDKKSKSAKLKWQNNEYRERYKKSRKEYVKIVKLDLNKNLLEIYPTFADAEKSVVGKRTNGLWSKMKRSNDLFVKWKNFIWIKLDDFNKLGKQETSIDLRKCLIIN